MEFIRKSKWLSKNLYFSWVELQTYLVSRFKSLRMSHIRAWERETERDRETERETETERDRDREREEREREREKAVKIVSCSYFSRCVKSVQIRSFLWYAFSCIRTEYRKIQTRKSSVFGQFSDGVCVAGSN